ITKGGTFTIEGGWDFTTNTHSTDASLTVVDGSQTGRVFRIDPQNADLVLTIKDLTIQNGKKSANDGQAGNNYGGGLYAENYSTYKIDLNLQNNIFTNNQATGSYSDGGAMAIITNRKDVLATLTGNEIYNNHADYDSGGILFRTYGGTKILTVTMNGNNIHDNTSRFGAGMLFYNDGNNGIMNLNLTNNTISNNSVDGCFIQGIDLGGMAYGGGMGFITNGNTTTNLTLTGNTITGNKAAAGAGIYIGTEHNRNNSRYTAKITSTSQGNIITNNTILPSCISYANVANGGGVTIQSDPDLTRTSTFTFNNDTITGNSLYDLHLETDNRNLVNITAANSSIGTMRRYGSRDYDATLCPDNGWWKRPCILTDMGELSLTCTDADSDGYYAEGLDCGAQDCDDGNSSVNPGAVEIPNNNVDDDCNASTPVLSVSGNAYNYPIPLFRATMSANVNASSLGTSYVRYYYTRARINFASTSISGISVSNGTATVTGTGTVNGTAGYIFTATITNGSPDSIAIEIRNSNNSVYFSSSSKPVASGDYSLTGQ
ncbi:MAG: putative metal-binding motif-containing protein, partial [Nitrospirae bacterium]|nr:putative metal-binding motif-containing protein [Nitrospirota bacterium]